MTIPDIYSTEDRLLITRAANTGSSPAIEVVAEYLLSLCAHADIVAAALIMPSNTSFQVAREHFSEPIAHMVQSARTARRLREEKAPVAEFVEAIKDPRVALIKLAVSAAKLDASDSASDPQLAHDAAYEAMSYFVPLARDMGVESLARHMQKNLWQYFPNGTISALKSKA